MRSTVAVRRRCPNNYALLERAPSPAVTRDPGTSDSLNISPRPCWVVCPLGRTRGHGRRVISLTVAVAGTALELPATAPERLELRACQ